MNTRHYYYDKIKKSNCLDCKYPLINEQGISELVNEWNYGYEFVQNLSSQEVKRIYETSPTEYYREL